MHKPVINMKHELSEMLYYDIIVHCDYVACYKVWDKSKQPLYRHDGQYMEKRQKPLKLRVGCELTIL